MLVSPRAQHVRARVLCVLGCMAACIRHTSSVTREKTLTQHLCEGFAGTVSLYYDKDVLHFTLGLSTKAVGRSLFVVRDRPWKVSL